MKSDDTGFSFEETMAIMDAVELQRRRGAVVEEQLGADERIANLKNELRETYKKMGTEVTDAQIDKAIEQSLSSRWQFQPPSTGVPEKIANLYINRRWIGTHIIAPTIAGLALIGAAKIGVDSAVLNHKRNLESSVEMSVESAYATGKALIHEADAIGKSPFIPKLPNDEANQLQFYVQQATSFVHKTDNFFSDFCPGGESDNYVTIENFSSVSSSLQSILPDLTRAEENITSAEGILSKQEKLSILPGALDGLISKIKSENPPRVLLNHAHELYQSGMESVRKRQIAEAESAAEGLEKIMQDSSEFGEIGRDFSRVYSLASSEAVEDEAKIRISNINQSYKSSFNSGSVEEARISLGELQNLQQILSEEYKVEVVSKRGIISGLWRTSNDNPSRNNDDSDPEGKMFYLVVHAVDSRGNEMPVTVKNIENGEVEKVKIWGVRVPMEVYQRIKSDKIDNGLLDQSRGRFQTSVYSIKRRGYLDAQPIMQDESGNPLTQMGSITNDGNNWRSR